MLTPSRGRDASSEMPTRPGISAFGLTSAPGVTHPRGEAHGWSRQRRVWPLWNWKIGIRNKDEPVRCPPKHRQLAALTA
jgi:hypothetical protein